MLMQLLHNDDNDDDDATSGCTRPMLDRSVAVLSVEALVD